MVNIKNLLSLYVIGHCLGMKEPNLQARVPLAEGSVEHQSQLADEERLPYHHKLTHVLG